MDVIAGCPQNHACIFPSSSDFRHQSLSSMQYSQINEEWN